MIVFEQWGHGWRERFWSWLARRLPRELVYHAVIRCFAHGTTGQYGHTEAPGLTVAEALRRWRR